MVALSIKPDGPDSNRMRSSQLYYRGKQEYAGMQCHFGRHGAEVSHLSAFSFMVTFFNSIVRHLLSAGIDVCPSFSLDSFLVVPHMNATAVLLVPE
jgi:hypothetical protein